MHLGLTPHDVGRVAHGAGAVVEEDITIVHLFSFTLALSVGKQMNVAVSVGRR